MAAFTQNDKLMSITTPLGEDVLLLAGLRGTEAISRLFSFELDLLSTNTAISFEDIIGKRATVKLELADGGDRYLNGLICRFSQAAGRETEGSLRLSQYRATLVPWTWLLTRTSDSRIFQNLSVPEILDKIFQEKGFSDVSMEVQEQHDKREYCVQYRETDFNFISRLMEEEGIYYYFTHDKNTHTMVIADTPGKHRKLTDPVRHYRASGAYVEDDTISVMEKFQEVQAGKYTLNDFNFEMPNTTLKATLDSQQKLGPGEREKYDFPGGYAAKTVGDRLARLRMEEEEARITTIMGSGNCRAFGSGYRFSLKNALRQDMNDKEYLLVTVSHKGSQGWDGKEPPVYENSFTCIPFETPFRPPMLTPRPTIHGSQTAVVVGKSGEEIYTDKYGRVKVQFHWDREGTKDENASCWIRVGQIWAGQGWGAVWIPRVGHEVIVSFLEGDPDRPLITGSVYDGVNMPPYALPGEMTKSTIKSNSTKGGGGFNEIRFEDKKDSEQIFIHAQKNQDLRVEKDLLEWVGQDGHLIVTRDLMEQIDGDHHITVKGDTNEKVEGTASLEAVSDIQMKAGGKYGFNAATEIHLKAGTNLVLESGTGLTLKVGGNFISINPGGIFISGTMLNLNSGGSAGSGSGSSPGKPKLPMEAGKADPGKQASGSSGGQQKPPPPPVTSVSPQAQTMKDAAQSGAPFCEA